MGGVHTFPVCWFECECHPRDVLDGKSWAMDGGNGTERLICRANKKIDRL